MNEDFVVRLMDLPPAIKGITQYDDDGVANIYINARLNDEQQRLTLKHELRHVKRDDAYNEQPIEAVEDNDIEEQSSRDTKSNIVYLPVFYCE